MLTDQLLCVRHWQTWDLAVYKNRSKYLLILSKITPKNEKGESQEATVDCVYLASPYFAFHTLFQLHEIYSVQQQSRLLFTRLLIPQEFLPLVTFSSMSKKALVLNKVISDTEMVGIYMTLGHIYKVYIKLPLKLKKNKLARAQIKNFLHMAFNL